MHSWWECARREGLLKGRRGLGTTWVQTEKGFLNIVKLLGIFDQVTNLNSPVLWEKSFSASVHMEKGKTESQKASC